MVWVSETTSDQILICAVQQQESTMLTFVVAATEIDVPKPC